MQLDLRAVASGPGWQTALARHLGVTPRTVRRWIRGDTKIHPAILPRVASFFAAQTITTGLRLVVLESPFSGDIERNTAYARRCVADSLRRGEAPIASHLLYTQPGILDDDLPDERELGIRAGLAWLSVATASVVYTDLGISGGMMQGMKAAESLGVPVEMRSIES
jgi:DNA-binding transcriptional regulator YdaS (Cro superfamily)